MTPTASVAVAARSSASRTRSIPVSPLGAYGSLVNTATLPITTPCSLAPISAPHIQNGRLIRIACVSAT